MKYCCDVEGIHKAEFPGGELESEHAWRAVASFRKMFGQRLKAVYYLTPESEIRYVFERPKSLIAL